MEKFVETKYKKGEEGSWKGSLIATLKSKGYGIKYLLKLIYTK